MTTDLLRASALLLLAAPALALADRPVDRPLADLSPRDVIEQTAERGLSALEGRRAELEQDPGELYELIDEILLPVFDRQYAARLVLARHGRGASREQIDRFAEALYRYVMRQYADGLLEFSSDQLTILPDRGEDDDKRATVRTLVQLEDGTQVPVNYSLRSTRAGWKVYDVTVEGISYIKNYRTQFGSEISEKGLEAVIERLEEEAAAEDSAAVADAA